MPACVLELPFGISFDERVYGMQPVAYLTMLQNVWNLINHAGSQQSLPREGRRNSLALIKI